MQQNQDPREEQNQEEVRRSRLVAIIVWLVSQWRKWRSEPVRVRFSRWGNAGKTKLTEGYTLLRRWFFPPYSSENIVVLILLGGVLIATGGFLAAIAIGTDGGSQVASPEATVTPTPTVTAPASALVEGQTRASAVVEVNTPTLTPTHTATPRPTDTAVPTPTAEPTATPMVTSTPVPTATPTAVPTVTTTPTPEPTIESASMQENPEEIRSGVLSLVIVDEAGDPVNGAIIRRSWGERPSQLTELEGNTRRIGAPEKRMYSITIEKSGYRAVLLTWFADPTLGEQEEMIVLRR